jgi:cytoskeleton protein RodZ
MSEVFQADFGVMLKTAREAKNMSQADVAAKLKLTPRQIEALETEDFGNLPSELFVRGFVRNYARLVGIEPDSLLTPVNVRATVSETITAPSAGLNLGSSGMRRWVIYPLLAITLFLLLVTTLYYWLRQGEDALIQSPPEVSVPQAVVPDLSVPQVEPTAIIDATQPPGAAVSESVPSGVPPAMGVLNPAPPASQPTQPVQPNPNPLPPKSEVGQTSSLRSMHFQPAQDAWIQVVDAKGSRFSKLVRAGASESFSGEPPFRLVVGEAALVKLTYNGHSIDLTPFIGEKVARLTLE